MGRDNLCRLADAGVYWVPTAVTMEAYAAVLEKGTKQRDVALATLDNQLEQISWARDAGTAIALGTDAGSPGVFHGEAAHRELSLFLLAGMSLPEAVKAATTNGAALMGLQDIGAILRGKKADLLVCDGPPENLVQSLKHPFRVMAGGA